MSLRSYFRSNLHKTNSCAQPIAEPEENLILIHQTHLVSSYANLLPFYVATSRDSNLLYDRVTRLIN